VSSAIGSVDTITQQNAIMVDKTSDQIIDLSNEVEKLTEALRGFKTSDPAFDAARGSGPDRRQNSTADRSRKPYAA